MLAHRREVFRNRGRKPVGIVESGALAASGGSGLAMSVNGRTSFC